jgi:DMSO/TMAO reductase YedYZ molybdopterin-dependent catalytic subunit
MSKRKLLMITLALVLAFLSLASLTIFLKLNTVAEDLPKGSEWVLLVDGFVRSALNLSYSEILAMPKTTVNAELYCVDNPNFAIAKGNWTGVKLRFILEKAQITSDAVKVVFRSNDDYNSDLPVTTAMREDIIIAYELNGQPLPEKLRLAVPGKWGYKWVSHLAHIELVNYDFKGTWESRGYSDEANIP